ncbi:SOUL heme-binding protein [Natronoarchaeum philippinense]|uniref:SOUL heme-binding protein n=1 Tax=Natronoarchaeum philippinense TaxID=558529 RepID=A0A285NTB7_NATPI|nr:heme-binding protein [Natronoarchaeum philippinense]SNZ12257.1 SOUL heme-binding protein [Natronoarchaeum philippinense]
MALTRKSLATVAAGALAAWTAWGLYARQSADPVPSTTIRMVDGVELRRYPPIAVAETTAEDQTTAFRRLFNYITGDNETASEIEMTAPVRSESTKIPMTAPVRSKESGDGMTMGFYLPPEYGVETPPEPTDPDVTVRSESERVLAVRSFSWYATSGRVDRIERDLLDTLDEHGVEAIGEPFLLRYDDPWTPPFMRRNEVAIEVA